MPNEQQTALILDDDPSHLKIYSWIVERAGFKCQTVLVRSSSVDLPSAQPLAVVMMDYRYSSSLTAADIMQSVKEKYPGVPVIVLSEVFDLPTDMASHATAFDSCHRVSNRFVFISAHEYLECAGLARRGIWAGHRGFESRAPGIC